MSSGFLGKGVGCALLVLLPYLLRAGLRAFSLFIPCENRECRGLVERLTICWRRCIDFNKRHAVTLKVYYGTRFSQEVCAQKTCCLRREWANKNEWWNLLPPNINETDCRPLTSRFSPVTPNGFIAVSRMALLELPGCKIEIFEPVSILRILCFPSMTTRLFGGVCSNPTAATICSAVCESQIGCTSLYRRINTM